MAQKGLGAGSALVWGVWPMNCLLTKLLPHMQCLDPCSAPPQHMGLCHRAQCQLLRVEGAEQIQAHPVDGGFYLTQTG